MWITDRIIKSIEMKDKLYKKMKIFLIQKQEFKNCSKILKHLIEQMKYDYYKSKIENNQVNAQKMWKDQNTLFYR